MMSRIKKRFLLRKWDLIKDRRRELNEIQRVEFGKRRAAKHLWKVNNMQKVVKAVYRVFKNRRFEVLEKETIMISATRILLMFKRTFKKLHPDIDERIKNKARSAFKVGSQLTQEVLMERSKQVSDTQINFVDHASLLGPHKLALQHDQTNSHFSWCCQGDRKTVFGQTALTQIKNENIKRPLERRS